jgi:AcrR family transcriptional regulator
MRHELREQKRDRYLRAARQVIVRDGLDGLTMQAMASEVGAAVGTIYGYFPSKHALLAELQVEAIAAVVDAWTEARDRWVDDLRAVGVADDDLPAATYLAFGEFFLCSQSDFAFEFDLTRLQFDASHGILESVAFARLSTVDRRPLLDGPADVVDGAMRAGGLDPDPSEVVDATSALLLSLYGVSLLSTAWPAAAHFAVPRLSRRMMVDVACGWGLGRGQLEAFAPIVRDVVTARPLSSMSVHRSRSLEATDVEDEDDDLLETSA